jgi:hypothetical protein
LVNGKTKVVGKWVHLAGVLTDDKQLRIYVNGKLAGSTTASGFLTGDPAEAMEIGADDGSTVGDYSGPLGFKGLIDEVKVYHRALSASEIEREIANQARRPADSKGLALAYSFDQDNAIDESPNKNNGIIEGVVAVKGRIGRAMKFTGSAGSVPGFDVKHNWTQDIPLLARAMVLADRTLFVAGPPDLVDEPQAFRQINDPKTKQILTEQAAAIAGDKGALLLVVSATNGNTLAKYDLDSPPVFDGMAAAAGHLYMTTVNGQVICMEPDN